MIEAVELKKYIPFFGCPHIDIVSDNVTLSDSTLKAEAFNAHFRNVGPNLAQNIPAGLKTFSDYFTDPVDKLFAVIQFLE